MASYPPRALRINMWGQTYQEISILLHRERRVLLEYLILDFFESMIAWYFIESSCMFSKCLDFFLYLFKISNFCVRLGRRWIFSLRSANGPRLNCLIHRGRLTISVRWCWALDPLWVGAITHWHWVICHRFSWPILTLSYWVSRYLRLLIHVLRLACVLLLLHFVF